MSHFQVSQDLNIFKSLETWMSHFQVSQDLDEVWKEEGPEA